MQPSILFPILMVIVAGAAVATQPAFNSQLAALLQSPFRAALVSFTAGATVLAALVSVLVVRNGLPSAETIAKVPPHLWVAGGALGALARYAVSEAVDVDEFPLGTFVVNVLGSFVLGLVAFAGVGGEVALLVGTGACGSFTTFSSFSFETVRLWETGERGRATANAAGNLLGAGVALALAWALVQVV